MRHRLKVSFRLSGKTYGPGDILPAGVSSGDLDFLKRKGFLEPGDDAFPAEDVFEQNTGGSQSPDVSDQDPSNVSGEDIDDRMGISFPDPGSGQEEMKSSEEIQKMRTKDEVYAYAQSIGLDLGDGYKERALKELQESVIAYQERAGMEALS